MKSAFAKTPSNVKWAANNTVWQAIKSGRLTRQLCSVCGTSKTLAHHEDYSKPLEVVWLCPKHHAARHKELRKIHGIKIRSWRVTPPVFTGVKMPWSLNHQAKKRAAETHQTLSNYVRLAQYQQR